MEAFHGDAAIKAKYLERVAAHRLADNLIQGTGWENGKGCAVGCTLEAYEHERYEIELGIPQILARLEDTIFEGLKNGKAQAWPERFLSAIRVGADLSLVGWKFLHWNVSRTLERYGTDKVREGCKQVVEILEAKAKGLEVSESAAESAWSAAWSAWSAAESARSAARSAWSAAESAWSAGSAARSAARSAWSAARSAWSAAESARSAAESARSAAESAAWSAGSAAYEEMADKLIELLEAA